MGFPEIHGIGSWILIFRRLEVDLQGETGWLLLYANMHKGFGKSTFATCIKYIHFLFCVVCVMMYEIGDFIRMANVDWLKQCFPVSTKHGIRTQLCDIL